MKRKLLIMIIIVVMLFGLTPVQAIIPGEDAYQPGLGITSMGILFSDIPETLSPAQIEEAGHIARLREEETGKNTAVFQNEDGTNTMYFFAQDIWYENAQGQKMDYSTEIELQPNGTYIGQSNTKTIVLPNRISQGITYSENGYTIEMVPSMDTVISNPIVYETEEAEPPEPTEGPVEVPTETEEPTEEPVEVPTETEEPTEEPVEVPTETEEPTEEPIDEPTETEEPVAEPAEVEEPEPIEETYERPYSLMNTNTVAEYNPNMVQNIVNGLVLNKPAQLQRNIYEESGREKSTVLYENAYSSDIDIETVPLLHGVRQDIKINDIGRTSFSFKVDTNGLIPQNSTGYSIALVDNTGKEQMSITSEPIMDESGNISMNNILDIAPYPDGTYLVTLTVDQEFVANAISRGEEVYAPLASQTISDYYVYDTYVSEAVPYTNFNSNAAMVTGCYGSGNRCRIYIKFLLESAFDSINPNIITAENLYLTDYSSSHSGSTTIYPYIPELTWNNATLTWSMANVGWSSTRNGVTVPGGSGVYGGNTYHTINLTRGIGLGLMAAFIREDIDPSLSGTIAQDRGIVLVNANENTVSGCRTFRTANASSGRPYVVIAWSTPVTGVSLNITSRTLDVNDELQLTATIQPSNATNKAVTWTSSNTSVATVSSTGKVTAKANGTAVITVKTNDGNKTATCTIKVLPGIGLNVASKTLDINGTLQLTATKLATNAVVQNVVWTSSNLSVAEVSNSGLVTAKGFGNATITATTADGNYSATCSIYVRPSSYTTLTLNNEVEGTISSGEIKWYKFVPTETKYYEFKSTGDTDVNASLYKDAYILLNSDNDNGTGMNFYICAYLTAGNEYFLKVECGSTSTDGDYIVKVQNNYGDAISFEYLNYLTSTTTNCLGYSLRSSDAKNNRFPGSSPSTIGEDVAFGIQQNLRNNGYADAIVIEIDGPSAFITNSQYRIAFRAEYLDSDVDTTSINSTVSPNYVAPGRYHFLVQLDTGEWAHKVGEDGVRTNLGYINPSSDGDYWPSGDPNYNDFDTYYIAVDFG